MAGIGWMLVDQRGTIIIKGSASNDPLASFLEAEAFALSKAIQQVKRHGYISVAFFGDLKVLCDTLGKCLKGEQRGRNQEISIYCEDIKRIANEELGFKFDSVPREAIHEVDSLAKKARMLKSKYVITWFPYV